MLRNKDKYQGKNITIIGLARSGLACARLLHELGASLSISDSHDTPATRACLKELPAGNISVQLGFHSVDFIAGRDMVVVSPGVTRDAEPVRWAQEWGIPVISEIEAAWSLCPAAVIAVTGSCGKTTVTTLIGRILEAHGRKVSVCGNIGRPFSGEVGKMGQKDFVSLELSSFQLERIEHFKPKIAVILNVTRNHLDRHSGMDEYIRAKKRIFKNQDTTDYLVLNADDPAVREFSKESAAAVRYFSKTDRMNPNQAAVWEVGRILGISEEVMLGVFKKFAGLEHRLEHVADVNGVQFINDSKATTVESARWAIENTGKPIILIAGGRHKGVDYRTLLDSARSRVKAVVVIGEAACVIQEALSRELACEEAASLQDAVHKALAKASAGDCVLLSPMCSSYDMFTDYEDRGRQFKEIVMSLAAGETASAHLKHPKKIHT